MFYTIPWVLAYARAEGLLPHLRSDLLPGSPRKAQGLCLALPSVNNFSRDLLIYRPSIIFSFGKEVPSLEPMLQVFALKLSISKIHPWLMIEMDLWLRSW